MKDDKNKVPVAGSQELSDETLAVLQEKEIEEEIPLEKNNSQLYVIGIAFSVFVFIAVGVLFYFKVNFFKEDDKKTIEIKKEAPITSQSPVQTPLPKGDITIEVLNGTGITGEAKRVGDKIQNLGYRVIKTGNAERADKTTILINKNLEGKLGTFLSDMKTLLGVENSSGYLEISTASAQIILGN